MGANPTQASVRLGNQKVRSSRFAKRANFATLENKMHPRLIIGEMARYGSGSLTLLGRPTGWVMLLFRFAIATFVLTIMGVATQTPARADSADDALARVQALEKENAAIKKENEALRQMNKLRKENASLKENALPKRHLVTANSGPSAVHDPQEAYAADLPAYVKAVAAPERGRLRLWGEGGAIWSGGDPIDSFYNHAALTSNGLINEPRFFPLVPKVGWEAAAGFDYRFAGSPWHASGQFRYGEARTSVSSSDSSSLLVGGPPPTLVTVTNDDRATHKETHWLADLALGRDVIGGAADALQLKFGVRVAELHAETNGFSTGNEITPGGTLTGTVLAPQDHRFLGAGPRFGIEGSAPIGPGWSFDYLGDAAVLFGTQKFQRIQTSSGTFQGVPQGVVQVPPESVDKFGTVYNSDIQLGVSYWMSQNAKISLSYRLDAYFNVVSALDVQNDATRLHRIDRYTHGPRLGVTAEF